MVDLKSKQFLNFISVEHKLGCSFLCKSRAVFSTEAKIMDMLSGMEVAKTGLQS